MQHRLTQLDSGVRVVSETMPDVRSVALGFWIATGSRAEDEAHAGLSHLLEHLLFRGSARFGSLEIDQIFDAMGAELNAGTGKESTSVYSRVLDRHLPRAFEVIDDMVWRPALDELDAEREVVLEEIAMYLDDPQDRVFDVLGEAVFGAHPLGRAIIGRREVIAGTPRAEIAAFHDAHYAPANVVIAAAGSVDHDELVALAQREAPQPRPALAVPEDVPADLGPRLRFERKDTEQYHVCLGGPSIARDDERRFALRVLDTIVGGTSSSRLFQEVREKRGLAYSVYTFSSLYAGVGQVGLYLGTRAENLMRALEVVAAELERLRHEPPAEDELTRAKENAKGRLVLSLESTTTRMNRLGSAVLAGMPLLSVDEMIDRIDAVELEDVHQLALELLAPEQLSAAAIGPEEEPLRAALERLSPTLVRAAA